VTEEKGLQAALSAPLLKAKERGSKASIKRVISVPRERNPPEEKKEG